MYIQIDNDGHIAICYNAPKTERLEKGKSLITFPEDYTVIDLETTGYSPIYDEIIELGAIKVKNSVITETFSSLVNRDGQICVNSFITELTGITQEMINTAPDIKDVLPQFLSFIGSDIVIGHNVNFDINFLYDASMHITSRPFTNSFVDTMRISRRLHPDQKHHRLKDLAERYSIDYHGSHRSRRDCEITKLCFDSLSHEILQIYNSYDNFMPVYKQHQGVKARDILSETNVFNESHALYGKVCVFTGSLEKMTRREAMQIVANLGGINADSVTKKTNYLILGCNDYCKSIKDGKSNKQKRAEQLQLEGIDISVISEDVFYDIIDEAKSSANLIDEQIAPLNLDKRSFIDILQDTINSTIVSYNLPDGSIFLYSNISSKGKNAGKETSKSLCLYEPEYPPTKSKAKNPDKNFIVLRITDDKDGSIDLAIRSKQFREITVPATAIIRQTSSDNGFFHVIFNQDDDSIYSYIENNIIFCLENYSSGESFACCSKYVDCSDARKCLHENKMYAMKCKYRKNLEAGKIFYGVNKNI